MDQIFEVDNLKYLINEKERTASVTKSELAKGEIIIPYSIIHNSIEYVVTSILEGAFTCSYTISSIQFASNSQVQTIEQNSFFNSSIQRISFPASLTKIKQRAFLSCNNLQLIEFPPDSKLKTIENDAFFMSKIESITFPPNLVELEERWCNGMHYVTKIEVSKDNKLFKVYKNQFIIGKSSPEKENFDVLVFSVRNIKNAQIPSFIEIISPYAFGKCEKLQQIEFSTETNFQSNLTQINKNDFSLYDQLETVDNSSNSKLRIISKDAFIYSSIETLLIPSKVTDLKDGWCQYTKELNRIKIMPDNHCYQLYKDKFIIGKSSINADKFDTLVFCIRNLKKVKIPSFIEIIGKYAFDNCQIRSIEIPEDSKLQIIDDYAFKESQIKYINIPSKIKKIGDYCFVTCMKLQRIEIPDDSEINEIGEHAFSNTKIDKFKIPLNVTKISVGTFSNCVNLKRIEFPADSKVQIIQKEAFSTVSIGSISIPSEVKKIENGTFFFCMKIQIFEINEDSKLETINMSMFLYIENIHIMIPVNLNHIINFDKLK